MKTQIYILPETVNTAAFFHIIWGMFSATATTTSMRLNYIITTNNTYRVDINSSSTAWYSLLNRLLLPLRATVVTDMYVFVVVVIHFLFPYCNTKSIAAHNTNCGNRLCLVTTTTLPPSSLVLTSKWTSSLYFRCDL